MRQKLTAPTLPCSCKLAVVVAANHSHYGSSLVINQLHLGILWVSAARAPIRPGSVGFRSPLCQNDVVDCPSAILCRLTICEQHLQSTIILKWNMLITTEYQI